VVAQKKTTVIVTFYSARQELKLFAKNKKTRTETESIFAAIACRWYSCETQNCRFCMFDTLRCALVDRDPLHCSFLQVKVLVLGTDCTIHHMQGCHANDGRDYGHLSPLACLKTCAHWKAFDSHNLFRVRKLDGTSIMTGKKFKCLSFVYKMWTSASRKMLFMYIYALALHFHSWGIQFLK
jgi:hypothetical protein